jgi:NitT/TauT family transport system substrate-binding protein
MSGPGGRATMRMPASSSRRVLLRNLAGVAAGGVLGLGACRRGDESGARRIGVHTVGSTLGIHTPAIAAWSELLGEVPGYGPATITRLDRLPVVTQSIISGAGDIGDGDILTTLRAIRAGADLKIIGLSYHSTGLVIVANKGRVPTAADLAAEGTVVAINSRGDFTHVLLLKPLQDAGVDPARLNILEIGGSGDRMRALLAGRVHAVPVHLDQAAELLAQGDFHVIIEPWQVFPTFPCAVLLCRGAWLADPANRPAAVALVAATMRGFRRANADLDWFTDRYRTYATRPDREKLDAETLRPLWETLRDRVRAWPERMELLSPETIQALVPFFRQADALPDEVDIERALDMTVMDDARRELDRDA